MSMLPTSMPELDLWKSGIQDIFRVLKFPIKRDVIAVVKNGAIVEKGRDETLVNVEDGFYPSLVQLHTNAKT